MSSLIITNPRTKASKIISLEGLCFGDFVKTAQIYEAAGFEVIFKRAAFSQGEASWRAVWGQPKESFGQRLFKILKGGVDEARR